MQNKYKMPSDVRRTVISIVQGYERRRREIREAEEDITSLSGARFETVNGERVYLPSGKGGKSSVSEVQAMRLMNLHNSFDYRCNIAIEDALNELPLQDYNTELAEKVKNKIMLSCVLGKRFIFRYEGLEGISERMFYYKRSEFLHIIAKKLNFL